MEDNAKMTKAWGASNPKILGLASCPKPNHVSLRKTTRPFLHVMVRVAVAEAIFIIAIGSASADQGFADSIGAGFGGRDRVRLDDQAEDCPLNVQLLQHDLHIVAQERPEADISLHRTSGVRRGSALHGVAAQQALPRRVKAPLKRRRSGKKAFREARPPPVEKRPQAYDILHRKGISGVRRGSVPHTMAAQQTLRRRATVSAKSRNSNSKEKRQNRETKKIVDVLKLAGETFVLTAAFAFLPLFALYALGTYLREDTEDSALEARGPRRRSFCCGCCSCSATTAFVAVWILNFAALGFYLLWTTNVIQAVFKELVVYLYLLLVVVAVAMLGIVELYADINFLSKKAEAVGNKLKKAEKVVTDTIPGFGQENETIIGRAARDTYNRFGTWSVLFDQKVEQLLSGRQPAAPAANGGGIRSATGVASSNEPAPVESESGVVASASSPGRPGGPQVSS